MSTITGEEGVRLNLAPRRTRPGLRGRRLALCCENEHIIPQSEHFIWLELSGWSCQECGTRNRRWVWLCAPLWREGWEWLVWGVRWLIKRINGKDGAF